MSTASAIALTGLFGHLNRLADAVDIGLGYPAALSVPRALNQPLSSDRNQPGDAFSASLARPLVVDGIVVAQTGQMVGGHVVEAQKAGRVSGTSRLKVQLTDLNQVARPQPHT